ncbi:MAG: GntR family transcriptional regulator, partial [Ferrovibrionaceae bacterium]
MWCKCSIALGAINVTQDFRSLADRLAADIAAGRLKPGDRLPPQREFAYRHGIAA